VNTTNIERFLCLVVWRGCMYEDMLRELGLSVNESRVYEALLVLGEGSVQEISVKSKVHRRNVYDSLSKLVEKGLTYEVFIKGEKNFKAAAPDRLMSLLKEKESRLDKVLPEMQKKYEVVEEKEEAYVNRGIEGFKNYLRDILKTKKDVHIIGAKAIWLDPRLKHFIGHFQKERKRLGIKFYHIFDHEVKEQMPEILKFVGKPYKFFPPEYSSPTMLDIFGDYVVTFVGAKIGHLKEEPVQFVMKSKELADGYRKYFQYMWDTL